VGSTGVFVREGVDDPERRCVGAQSEPHDRAGLVVGEPDSAGEKSATSPSRPDLATSLMTNARLVLVAVTPSTLGRRRALDRW
jgi:hypothetical protein